MPYELAVKLGIAEFHPDHPSNRGKSPVLTATVPAPRSKYRNISTVYNGVKYSSKAEAVRAAALDADAAAGLVRFWVAQPKFRLGVPENVYVADFLVVGLAAAWVEDTKGCETAKFRRDKKLWASYGPCPLKILRRGKVVEVIDPKEHADV